MVVTPRRYSAKLPLARAIGLITGLAIGLICTGVSGADVYPSKPIRLIVPFSPGGGSDSIARLIGPKMTDALGQQVVVDNRPGGNTVIGVGLVGAARPDGYT